MLITRPQADSLALKAEVEALGYDVMIEPLMTIEQMSRPPVIPDDVQLLVLTSAHAVPALTDQAKSRPIYAVGKATADVARAAGCGRVVASDGNVQDLSRLIVEECRPQDGSILHFSGEVIREGLAEALRDHGFHYRRQVTYRAVEKKCFSDDVVDAFQQRAIAAVLLFSPRTAEVLVRLLSRHDLASCVDSTSVICLSEETATPCKTLVWRTIRPAARPNRKELLRALVGSTTYAR